MTTINYNFQKKVDEKRIAKAYKSNAKISTKYSVEFCNYFNGMMLSKAIKIANDIKEKKDFLPLVKYYKSSIEILCRLYNLLIDKNLLKLLYLLIR